MSQKERVKSAVKATRKKLGPKEASIRKATTLYLDQVLYRKFQKESVALGSSASLIIEDLMREFLL